MPWTLCTSGAALDKAGTGRSSAVSGAMLQEYSNLSEGTVNFLSRQNWSSTPATANFSGAVAEAVSDHIAMKIINYDMSGYTSRTEAQTMLDRLRDSFSANIEALKDDKNKEVAGV